MQSKEAEKVDLSEVEQVFAQWCRRQNNPDRCLLSKTRETLISARLKEYTVRELISVVQWAYGADDSRAIFLRENGYTDLDNLFRKNKIDGRIEAASAWLEETTQTARPAQQKAHAPVVPPGPAKPPAQQPIIGFSLRPRKA